MPCYECEEGKWRFGETGDCQYESKSDCETANKDYYAEETYNDYPEAATNNAKRAIKYKKENGSDCGTIIGWTRAGQEWAIRKLEKIDNKNMAKKKKYYSDEDHDHHFHFTKEMMEVLHSEGELEVRVEEDEKEMLILFTYDIEESEEYNPDEEEIKDTFDEYFDEVIKSIKK